MIELKVLAVLVVAMVRTLLTPVPGVFLDRVLQSLLVKLLRGV